MKQHNKTKVYTVRSMHMVKYFLANIEWNSFKQDKDAFIHVALSNLPGKSYDDVRQHDDWYSEYLILLEKKRKAIQEWKHFKDVSSFEAEKSWGKVVTSCAFLRV